MPRNDYEKLLTLKISSERYVLQNYKLGNLKRAITKIVDIKTHTTGYLEEDVNLWIDIFPIDGLPEDENEVKRIYNKVRFYRKLLYVCGARLGLGRTIIKKYLLYFLKPIANCFFGVNRCVKELNKIAKQYSYENAKYVGDIVGGIYGKTVEVEFEHHIFPTFSCWNLYLSGCHGDYMQLPPVEKRKAHIQKVFLEG